MRRIAFPMILVHLFGVASSPSIALPIQDAPSINAVWDLPAGRYVVGQGIDARIVLIAGSQPPKIAIPATSGVDLVLLPGVTVRPVSANEIGDNVQRTNEFRQPVRIIPRRSGRIVLPAITIQAEGRSGILPSRTISVIATPSSGRTGTFLGGVGRIVASAEARPDVVRVGDVFEYRIRLDGPGSIGSFGTPSVSGLDRLGLGLRVEPLPSEATIEPPSRTLRFRLRPSRAGSRSLPAFLVSWLDPTSGSYMTSATRAVPIRVVDVPEFKADDLELPTASANRWNRWNWAVWLGSAGLVFTGTALIWVRLRLARERQVDPRRIAMNLVKALGKQPTSRHDERCAAMASANAIAEFLHRAGGRPRGVLTPSEARLWVAGMGGQPGLAERTERLIERCDRTLYGPDGSIVIGDDSLTMTASRILIELGSQTTVGKPREAPGTA